MTHLTSVDIRFSTDLTAMGLAARLTLTVVVRGGRKVVLGLYRLGASSACFRWMALRLGKMAGSICTLPLVGLHGMATELSGVRRVSGPVSIPFSASCRR